jgi:hypothetical protein
MVLALGATVVLAVAVPATSSAAVKTTVTISKEGFFGNVKSANADCLEGRKVVVKQVGQGAIGRTLSDATGKWTTSFEEMNRKFDIELPLRLYAEVKASPNCLAATSKTVTL